ncbi:alpha-D-ribose 1-methylphosphonate 5-triphosphate diphosphatase [Chelatococcus asaccharovorans]|uniref:Alpha-D-ribose 1-methylphosphonate 5-triphosphate diphosphatase n=1 Tax=Chelatococcus asaccharovorans TaxID=28210 RepID=A0A2V3TXR0_9HYPH|nr:alpha-D-ribose 1-methylphosphonate 5-triphosphate diphosphatase [Chelatococcus asaccharovorans]MBS7704678.1 alpha-D-ribose 1-methylphosphonate 5-triphosphate diphosphatase [Chelatococcus asaccharovorans]PXW54579.1 alpha-D-ribose 1-methylphosphonate 5-triphosphate diphosphatase [Chelatococcus asaccharovorans]CAH1649152.1 RPnTP hydrolase [Chelatococcus asaccharovorans]CAH1687149.1 RPnTP hydrolase [Chelatococcus asaccharovorans]
MNKHAPPSLSTGSLTLAARRIVLADREIAGTVHMDGGFIVGLEEDVIAQGAIDCGDDLLIPGLVELHTDHLEPHFSPRPKVNWDAFSAVFSYDAQIAAAGITTVLDSLRVGRDFDNAKGAGSALFELGQSIARARSTGLLRADHYTHLRCEIPCEGMVDDARRYLAHFDVRLMSLMDHTPGERQFRDEEKLRNYYRGKTTKTDAELDDYFAERKRYAQLFAAGNKEGIVALAKAHGIAMASHDDTTEDHVAESLSLGVAVAEFPTTIEAAAASHGAGLSVLMGAPNVLLGGSHSGNVSARHLAEEGLLDILSSDYVPASLLVGAMALADVPAVGGIPGAIRLVTKTPAAVAGFTDRGEIAAGKRADVLRVALVDGYPVVREVYRQGNRVA